MSAYWGNDLEEKPKALYWMFVNTASEKATLELMMQKSPKELEFFQEFLGLWIGYLGNGTAAHKGSRFIGRQPKASAGCGEKICG